MVNQTQTPYPPSQAPRMGQQTLHDAYARQAAIYDQPASTRPMQTVQTSSAQWGRAPNNIAKILRVAVVSVVAFYAISLTAGFLLPYAAGTMFAPGLTGLASFSAGVHGVMGAIYTGLGFTTAVPVVGAIPATAAAGAGGMATTSAAAAAAVGTAIAVTSKTSVLPTLEYATTGAMAKQSAVGSTIAGTDGGHFDTSSGMMSKKSTLAATANNADIDLPEAQADQPPPRHNNSNPAFKKTGEINADRYINRDRRREEPDAQTAALQAQARMNGWVARTRPSETTAPKITERPKAPAQPRAASYTAQALEDRRLALERALKGPTPV